MSISSRYVFIASMDVTPEAEALLNEVYDTEHVPNLLQVPGVRSVTRMKGEPARFAIAGGLRELPAPSPNLHSHLRDRRSASPGKPAMGGSRRAWPLAERSTPAHVKSAASAVQGSVSRAERGNLDRSAVQMSSLPPDPSEHGMRDLAAWVRFARCVNPCFRVKCGIPGSIPADLDSAVVKVLARR